MESASPRLFEGTSGDIRQRLEEMSIEVDETLFTDEDYKTAYETLRAQYLQLLDVSNEIENANDNLREEVEFLEDKLTYIKNQVQKALAQVRQTHRDYTNEAAFQKSKNWKKIENDLWRSVVEMKIAFDISIDLITRRDVDE